MISGYNFSQVTPDILAMSALCSKNGCIDQELYTKYDVKRGLRDINGKGVLAGLTEISEIISSKTVDGKSVPCDGELYYRGYNINDLVTGFTRDKRFGFEEITYLLLFGELPSKKQLDDFSRLLSDYRQLPTTFVRDIIMKSPSNDIMNGLARGVLTLYSYDDMPNDISIPNVLRQSLELIALFPLIAVYSYQAKAYYHDNDSFFIHQPNPEYSTAENILHMLRSDSSFTALEAHILDLALVLHAEHGGGNNSTFTCRTLTSADTDAYSAYSAAIGSLKGQRHGGANFKVIRQLEEFKENISDWENDGQVADYIAKVIRKEAGDGSGLVYGMGHAVYTLSDPRAVILKRNAVKLAQGTEYEKEFRLLDAVERLTPEVFANVKGSTKTMCANVDLYSGLVYRMLKIPVELNTPLFAVSRISGWAAHRIEELINGRRIIRPAYKAVAKRKKYIPLGERV